MSSELRELYQATILDHNRSPRNFRTPEVVSHQASGHNPLCGDRLTVYLRQGDDGRIEDIAFQGTGCAISVASASMMTQALTGKDRAEALDFFERFQKLATGEGEAAQEGFEKLQVFAGVREFPMRVKCATLAWHTMKSALEGGREVARTE